MRATRIVVVVGIIGLFVAALVFEKDPRPATVPLTVDLGRMVPTVPGDDALSSTWYCTAGSARGEEGPAEQTLVIANDGEAAVVADLTVHTDTGEQVREQVDLAGRSRTEVRVGDLVTSDWASVVVEAPGGGIGVDHVVSGPTGSAAGPCASSVAPSWYLPSGSTSLGIANRLAIFNPFAADAVVDIAFETETDRRTPPEYEGLVIPAGHVRVLPVDEVVTVRERISTQVVARTGLVVVEQLELIGAESELPSATTLLAGAPATAQTWHLPAGRPLGGDVDARVAVFNPSDTDAEVDVQVLLDDPTAHEPVEPFELTVFAGQYAEVGLLESGRMPEGVAWSAFAASRNDVPVVAAVTTTAAGESDPRGISRALGSPVMASEWRVPLGGTATGELTSVELVNPTSQPRSVRLEAVGAGSGRTGAEVVVQPGTRASLSLDGVDGADADDPESEDDATDADGTGGDDQGPGAEDESGGGADGEAEGGDTPQDPTGGEPDPETSSWRVVADGGVVVARTSSFADGGGFSSAPALAVSGSLALAPAPEVDLTVDPSIALEGIVPEDSAEDTSGSTTDTSEPESEGSVGEPNDDGGGATGDTTAPSGGEGGGADGSQGGDGTAGDGGADTGQDGGGDQDGGVDQSGGAAPDDGAQQGAAASIGGEVT